MSNEILREPDEKMRERAAAEIQRAIEAAGVNRYGARTGAQSLMGGESSNFPGGVGIADFVPFLGTTLAMEEGAHDLADASKAAQRGDYIDALGKTAGAAVSIIPGAPGTIKAGKALLKKIKAVELPKLKPITTDSVPKKQSLREWYMAGGGVPLSHKDRPDVWHKKVQRFAAGGEVFNTVPDMSDGGRIIDGPAFAGGGAVKRFVKEAISKAVKETKEAPTIIVPSKLSRLKESVRQSMGDFGARRVERAADEIPNLERMYKEHALKEAFSGDNAKALMTMNPKHFERYAAPLDTRFTDEASTRFTSSGEPISYREYIENYLPSVGKFNDVPFLEINKKEQGLPITPFISGHEGRHRNRVLSNKGETTGLVRLLPRAELREPFPRRSQEEYIQALRNELDMTGNFVLPEKYGVLDNSGFVKDVQRPAIVLPDVYAKGGDVQHLAGGGEVHMAGGGAKKIVRGIIDKGVDAIKNLTTPKGVEPIVVRTPEERELKGAMRPSAEPVRGQTSKELRAMQREQLTPEQKEKLSLLKSKYPEFARASKFMMPNEISKIIDNPRGVGEMNSLLRVIPTAKEMASVAKTGEAKRGWYRASTQAIMNVFGDDAPRFSSLLAALSPQNSVETNLLNTLNTWKNWTAAGRPTDDRSIREILGRSVQGTKGEESVLEAWAQNAIRSLSAQDPTKVVLSGAKVDSFWRNLADDVYRVTNDAWMANGMGIQQKLFGQTPTELQLRRGDPGFTPGYIGASARTREAGEMANMLPSEAQETTWSTFMPLYEMQEKYNLPAREILQRGMLTPEAIRGTPDFSTLFHDPTYGKILEQSGYGERLAGLKPHQWPEARIDLSLSEQRDLERSALRLEDLRSGRNMETRSRTVSLPSEGAASRTYPYETAEYIPMRGSGHAEEMIDAPMGQRQAFSSKMSGAFTDFSGKDVLHGALGLPGLKTVSGLGSYRPPGRYPWMTMPMENQPMFAIGVESPVTSSMDLPRRTHEKMTGAAALRGAMTGQGGQAYHAQIPNAGGSGLVVPLDKKVGSNEMIMSSQLLPPNVFLADTGRGVSVINPGKKFDESEAKIIAQRLGGKESIPATTRGNYIDYSGDWMKPHGSGAVTRKMLSHLEPLSANDLKSLSEAAQVPAGKVYDAYKAIEENKGYVVREDLMRLLSILRDKGIPGVTAALAAGEALPSEPEQPKRAGGLAFLKYGEGRA